MIHDIEEVSQAHIAGIDLGYRAPDLPASVRSELPAPIIENDRNWLDLYWRCWSIAFDKLRNPPDASGLVPYCDAAFSHNIFQWDTCFMLAFLRYAPDSFLVEGSLDNFYRKQHDDGFICREINSITGADFWDRSHPSSINPPLFADAEWSLYKVRGDAARLRSVLPPLVRYYQWLERHRIANDGIGYWTTALGSGMDNSPRAYRQGGPDVHKDYGYVWMCMSAQQALAALRIAAISTVVGEADVTECYSRKGQALTEYVRSTFWNDEVGCYADKMPDGKLTDVITPAMCWPLLLPGEDNERAGQMEGFLADPQHLFRPHACASLSARHELFDPRGNYWCGSVWPPMVYLAARAMQAVGKNAFAYRMVANHLDSLDAVYRSTGTFWENYAPDEAAPGQISRPEFIGWTGCGPIALLIESIIGVGIDAPGQSVTWEIQRDDRHGIRNLPLGGDRIDLVFDPSPARVTVKSGQAFDLTVIRDGRTKTFHGLHGEHCLALA